MFDDKGRFYWGHPDYEMPVDYVQSKPDQDAWIGPITLPKL